MVERQSGTELDSFTMVSTRAAMHAGLTHVERQVTALEGAIGENAGLVFDLARALVESACRTILEERQISHSSSDDLPQLFRTVTANTPVLPANESDEAEVRQSVVKTLNGLHTSIQGLCELRNQCGFASHGSPGPRPAMEELHARMAAETADAIVGFLYQMHVQDLNRVFKPEIAYEPHEEFNESIDAGHAPVEIMDAVFRPSEVLFRMEPESYEIYLAEFGMTVEDISTGTEENPT